MKCTRQLVATGSYAGKYISVVVKKKGRQYQWGVLSAASPTSVRQHQAYSTAGSAPRAAKEAIKAARRIYPGIELAIK